VEKKRARRWFTAEFKAQAVRRVLDGTRGPEIATELRLSTGQLSTWRAEQLAAGSAEMLAVRKAEEAETQRLKREVKHLRRSQCQPCELSGSVNLRAGRRPQYGGQ
jgi:transposase